MNVLLDTDILIDVALDRMPFAAESSAVLDMAQQRSFHAFIAWHSLSNFYYIVDSESCNLDSEVYLGFGISGLPRWIDYPTGFIRVRSFFSNSRPQYSSQL